MSVDEKALKHCLNYYYGDGISDHEFIEAVIRRYEAAKASGQPDELPGAGTPWKCGDCGSTGVFKLFLHDEENPDGSIVAVGNCPRCPEQGGAPPGELFKVWEALRYIVERENFAFAECSEAEAIWARAKEAMDIMNAYLPEKMTVVEDNTKDYWHGPTLGTMELWRRHRFITVRDWLGALSMLETHLKRESVDEPTRLRIVQTLEVAAGDIVYLANERGELERFQDTLKLIQESCAALSKIEDGETT